MTASTALRRLACLLSAAGAVYAVIERDPFGAALAICAFFGLAVIGRLSAAPKATAAPAFTPSDDPALRPIRRLYADEAWQDFYTSSTK